jgi:hypothetical protein
VFGEPGRLPKDEAPDRWPVQKYHNVDHVGVVNNLFIRNQKVQPKSAKSSEMII